MVSVNRPYVGRHVHAPAAPSPGVRVYLDGVPGHVVKKSPDGTALWCIFGSSNEPRMFTHRLALAGYREFPERTQQGDLEVWL
jgi:hypothetical protein